MVKFSTSFNTGFGFCLIAAVLFCLCKQFKLPVAIDDGIAQIHELAAARKRKITFLPINCTSGPLLSKPDKGIHVVGRVTIKHSDSEASISRLPSS